MADQAEVVAASFSFTMRPPWVTRQALRRSSSRLSLKVRLSLSQNSVSKATTLDENIWLAWTGTSPGKLANPTSFTPWRSVICPATMPSTLPPLSTAIDDDGAGAHGVEHVAGDQDGRAATEHLSGGNDDVGVGTDARHAVTLEFDLLFGERLGVAVLGLASLADVDLHELGTQRFHLLLHDRACVEGFHLRSETACGGDGLQPGDACADDEDFHRLDRASGRHHHGEDLTAVLGGSDDRCVSGEAGLGGKDIHLLRARGARDHLQANGADAALGKGAEVFRRAEGIEQGDAHRAFAHGGDVGGGGLAHADDDVRATQ